METKQYEKGDKLTIQGYECTVINVYDKTMSVETDRSNCLVRLKDMKFVVMPDLVNEKSGVVTKAHKPRGSFVTNKAHKSMTGSMLS